MVRKHGLRFVGLDLYRPATWGWFVWTVIISFGLNVFWIIWIYVRGYPPTVMDDWEQL